MPKSKWTRNQVIQLVVAITAVLALILSAFGKIEINYLQDEVDTLKANTIKADSYESNCPSGEEYMNLVDGKITYTCR